MRIASKIALGYALAAALLGMATAATYHGEQEIVRTSREGARTGEVLGSLREAAALLAEAASASRGYLFSGDPRRLDPYGAAAPRARQVVADLGSLTRGDPRQQARLDRLEPLVSSGLDLLERRAAARRDQGSAEGIAMSGDAGFADLDEARRILDVMEIEERDAVRLHERDARAAAERLLALMAVGIGAGLGLLTLAAVLLTRNLTGSIGRLAAGAEHLGGGELDTRVEVASEDELGELAASFNRMAVARRRAEALLTLELDERARALAATAETGRRLAEAGARILAVTTLQVEGAEEQALTTRQTATAVGEIAVAVSQTADQANLVAESSSRSNEVGQAGFKAIGDAIALLETASEQSDAITDDILALSEQTQALGEIIATVDDIAEQTNLLALNAAIEASRAGPQARGFSVVATEVRALADQSKKATVRVRRILGEIRSTAERSVRSAEKGALGMGELRRATIQAGQTIDLLSALLVEVAQAAVRIAAASGRQATAVAQVQEAIRNTREVTTQGLLATRQTEQAAEEIAALGEKLRGLLAPRGALTVWDEEILAQLVATFLDELDEHVGALNRDLLELEAAPPRPAREALYKRLLRTVHTIKGAARSVGQERVASAAHQLESQLSAIQAESLPPSPALIDTLYQAADAFSDSSRRLRLRITLGEGPLAALLAQLEGGPPGAIEPPLSPGPFPPISGARGGERGLSSQGGSPPFPPEPGERAGDRGVPGSSVRVAAFQIDALRTSTSDLLLAGRSADGREAEIAALLDGVKRWRAEWRSAQRPLQRAMTDHADDDSAAEAAVPVPVVRTLASGLGRLKQIEQDLERLAADVAADRRRFAQAAAPVGEQVERIGLLPFAGVCRGLDRAVRDLAVGSGKEVNLVIEGSDVGLDRAVLDAIRDPILHLVRNAIGHGIEPPEERARAGKPRRGRVTITAALRGAHVEVTVGDDGRGLDLDAIRAVAEREGFAADGDVTELIFRPGFSTSREVTELEGRGVGLDIVKSHVDALRGRLGLSSVPREGTRFVLTFPVTLTKVHALLVAVSGPDGRLEVAIPAVAVVRLLRFGAANLVLDGGSSALSLGGVTVPLVRLTDILALGPRGRAARGEGAPPSVRRGGRTPAFVLAAPGQIAFAVDSLIGEQELIVKSLGPRLAGLRHLAGASILPSGRLVLLLNAGELVDRATGRRAGAPFAPSVTRDRPRGKRVLLAEDSPTTRSLEQSILEAAGFEVLLASDGMEAWELLLERGADLVVSDVEMPRLDGFGLTEAIRRSDRFRDVPVVLVTALGVEPDRKRGIEVGANAYLVKSAFDQQIFVDTLEQLL